MHKIKKHYTFESGGSIYFDKTILQRFELINIFLTARLTQPRRTLLTDATLEALGVSGGWRKKVLAMWEVIKPFNGYAGLGKLIFKEWRVRAGTPWAKSQWICQSRRHRGKLPEPKKTNPPVPRIAARPVPGGELHPLRPNFMPRNGGNAFGYRPVQPAPPQPPPILRGREVPLAPIPEANGQQIRLMNYNNIRANWIVDPERFDLEAQAPAIRWEANVLPGEDGDRG